MEPEPVVDYEQCVQEALDSLPADLRTSISNVAIVVKTSRRRGNGCSGSTRAFPSPDAEALTVRCFRTRSRSIAARWSAFTGTIRNG